MAKTGNSDKSDFDAIALTQKTDEHTTALDGLNKRVGTNENFAKTFQSAAATQTPIQEAIRTVIVKQLENDDKAKKAVEVVVKDVDGREMKKQLLGLGKIVLWVISVIVAALAGALINSLFNKH